MLKIVKVITIVIGALGTIPKALKSNLGEMAELCSGIASKVLESHVGLGFRGNSS